MEETKNYHKEISVLKEKLSQLERKIPASASLKNQLRLTKYQAYVNHIIENHKSLLSTSVASMGFVTSLLMFYKQSSRSYIWLFFSGACFLLSITTTLIAMCNTSKRIKEKNKAFISMKKLNQWNMIFFSTGIYSISLFIVCDFFCKHS